MQSDTSPEAMERYVALLRAQSPVDRLRAAARLTTAVRRLAEAGIRAEHPHATDEEVRTRLTVRIYGVDTAKRLFGSVPDDAR